MAHVLPTLSYAYDALEPYIDAKTMEIHHGKHHAAYVANMNAAIEKYPDLQTKSGEELIKTIHSIPEHIRTAVRSNGGGVINHNMYWQQLKLGVKEPVSGLLFDAVKRDFGSFEAFKEQFQKAGMTRFGSGWAWLVMNKDGLLQITSTANQDSPLSDGLHPILTADVWEHAYYLKYQNRRADYLAAFWNVVNWNDVQDRFAEGK